MCVVECYKTYTRTRFNILCHFGCCIKFIILCEFCAFVKHLPFHSSGVQIALDFKDKYLHSYIKIVSFAFPLLPFCFYALDEVHSKHRLSAMKLTNEFCYFSVKSSFTNKWAEKKTKQKKIIEFNLLSHLFAADPVQMQSAEWLNNLVLCVLKMYAAIFKMMSLALRNNYQRNGKI